MKKHEIESYSSNFMVPRSVNVDGYRYVLDDDEVKMLKEKFKEIYNEYVKQNVDIAEEK